MQSTARETSVPVVRLGHLQSFTNQLRYIGAPINCRLRRDGLPVHCHDPDHIVPLQRAWSFFDYAAHKEDPIMGWRVGTTAGEHQLNGALRHKLESAPTLLQALRMLVRKVRSEASHIELGISRRGNTALIYTHYQGMSDVSGYLVAQGYQLGVIVGLIRSYLGEHWTPDEIGIEATNPPLGLSDFFSGARIVTGHPFGYLAMPLSLLSSGSSSLGCDSAAGSKPATTTTRFADTLRALLPTYLADGYTSAAFASRLADVSERTLARRLSEEGLTFGQLVDEVRFSEARKLLKDPEIPVGEVARAVGFHDPSNFNRMFQRIAGVSASDYRGKLLH